MPYSEIGSAIARMYDGDYACRRTPCGDVVFYVEEAVRSGGPVLELGCGTGRILVPTAEAGVEIAGLDSSAPMLAKAEAKLAGRGLPASLHLGDMRDFDLGRRFELVTIPFRALSHVIEAEDQLRVLACVRRHLAPGGRLLFDVFRPNLAFLASPEPEKCDIEREEAGRKIRRFVSVVPHPARQVSDVRMRWEIEGPDGSIERAESRFAMRWFYRYEVEHLLARGGFEVEALYGDFDRCAAGEETPEMIFVARA